MKNLQEMSSIKDVLLQELDCFKIILSETRNVIKNGEEILDNDHSLDRISQLLESRERYIDQLKRLEDYKSQFAFSEKDHYEILNEISKNARTLVEIDAKLLDYIQMRKINKVKEITNIADHKNRSLNRRLNDIEKTKLIDIRQE
ncbi:MAG: hypothetical protein ACLFQM_02860 [Fidelibacterota bacterium]